MNFRLSWGIFLLLACLLGGCFGSNDRNALPDAPNMEPSAPSESRDRTAPAPSDDADAEDRDDTPVDVAEDEVPQLYIYNLSDRWNAAAAAVLEETEHHDLGKFEVSGWGESLEIRRAWGDEKNDDFVMLTGYVRKDDGRIERLYIRGKQTAFDESHLRHLQPYYEILIAASNPGLSSDERASLMNELSLAGDVATLAERSSEDGKNSVTKHSIQYDVAIISSGEGRTYALVVTMDAACNGNSILSSCR